MKRRSDILMLQEQYLRTRDIRIIEELYRQLVQLGMFILTTKGRGYQDPDDVRDLATDICLRLMERSEPVIRSAPSTYLRLALWYKRKPGMEIADFDALDKEIQRGSSGDYDSVADRIQKEAGVDPDTEMGALVGQTVESQMNWHKVLKALPELEQRRSFRASMKEVQRCARESARRRDAADW